MVVRTASRGCVNCLKFCSRHPSGQHPPDKGARTAWCSWTRDFPRNTASIHCARTPESASNTSHSFNPRNSFHSNPAFSLGVIRTEDPRADGAAADRQSCAQHDQPAREGTAAAQAGERELRREVRAAARDAGEPPAPKQRDDLPPPREGSGAAVAEPPAKAVPEEEKPGKRCWKDPAGTGSRSTRPPGALLTGGGEPTRPAPGNACPRSAAQCSPRSS